MKSSSNSWDAVSAWAVRLPALAGLAILICTLFPFQFLLPDTASRRTVPFLLWLDPYPDGILDFTENIILFLPIGLGWACWACSRRWKRPWALATAFAVGAALSYSVEFLQVFLPTRDPSWWDVLANTIGAVLGCSAFEPAGTLVLDCVAGIESWLDSLVSTRRIIVAFATYAALTLAVSALLQRSVNFGNWHPSRALLWGLSTGGKRVPTGRILRLEVTDHALLPGSARETSSAREVLCVPGDASGSTPIPSRPAARGILAPQNGGRPGGSPPSRSERGSILCLSGREWQPTPLHVESLVVGIQKAHTFTVRILYAPPGVTGSVAASICSIRDDPQHTDFDLTQRGRDAIFTFRTADLDASTYWSLKFPGAFPNSNPRDLLLTYDGRELVGYIDGQRNDRALQLDPGAILVCRLKGVNPYNVPGYAMLYEMVVFVPLGILLGFGVRKASFQQPPTWILLCAAVVAPALAQQRALSSICGCPFRFDRLILGCCLIAAAFLLSFRSPSWTRLWKS